MKNKMRRINIIITVLALMLTLTACGKSEFGVTENSWKHMTLTAQKCYCEEPDAGKPHVRICEGLRA